MIKILFVCLGNICRSPAAEAIMNHLLKANQLNKQVICDSAGLTTNFLGQEADRMMRELAAERSYHIHSISRPILDRDFAHTDFIFAMNDEILMELRLLAPDEDKLKKIQNICDFCEYHPEGNVPDPYEGDEEEFEFVLDIIEDACNGLLATIKKKIN